MYSLFVTMGYPTPKYITYGNFEFDQAKALKNQGVKVVYAAVDNRSIRRWRKWGIDKTKIEGIDIYSINIPLGRLPQSIKRKVSTFGLKLLYKKIEKDHGKPDIIHSHFPLYSYVASQLKKAINVCLVVTEHSSTINREVISKDFYYMAKTAYSASDALIVVSPSLQKVIKNQFNVSSTYIPNIVDLDIFEYREKVESDTFNFVSTGNLIDLKRMDLTITAFKKAFLRSDKVSLTIFGGGPNKGDLEDLISKNNLNSQVKLMGEVERSIIAKKYQETDAFVLASQTETFGVAYIEALAMGIPVIATKCGGPEAFVHKDNGIMIDVDNLDQLTLAMQQMYQNSKNYDHRQIAKKTSENFSPKTVANKIIEVYKDVLSK